MKEKLLTTLFALFAFFSWTQAAVYAQIAPHEPPIILPPPDVTIAYQRVNVTIDDQVATTHIELLECTQKQKRPANNSKPLYVKS